jgi:hypothetical protein
MVYFLPDNSIYRVFRWQLTTFCFAWRFLHIELNCEKHNYILALTRRGINIIQSDLATNQFIGYVIPENSLYIAFSGRE